MFYDWLGGEEGEGNRETALGVLIYRTGQSPRYKCPCGGHLQAPAQQYQGEAVPEKGTSYRVKSVVGGGGQISLSHRYFCNTCSILYELINFLYPADFIKGAALMKD